MRNALVAAVAAFSCLGTSDGLKVMNDYGQASLGSEGGNEAVSMLSLPGDGFVRPEDISGCTSLDLGVLQQDVIPVAKQDFLLDCWLVCKWDPRCKFFTYNLQTNNCYLKAGRNRTHKWKNDLMAPQGCPLTGAAAACPNCNSFNKVHNGAVLKEPFKVPSFEDCANKCATMGGCMGYAYVPATRTCTLRKENKELVNAPGTISGPISCINYNSGGVPSCVDIRTTCTNKTIEETKQPSLHACGARCQEVSGCKGYSFDVYNGTCWLKDGYDSFSISGTQVSAPVGCQAVAFSRCTKKNYRYTAKPLETRNVTSMDRCRVECEQSDKCEAYTYNVEDRSCQMFDADGAIEEAAGVISAPLRCPLTDIATCVKYNHSYTTDTLKQVNNVMDMTACRDQCRNVKECNFYTYSTGTRTCYLKASVDQGMEFQYDRSAHKNCDLNGHSPCLDLGVRMEGTMALPPKQLTSAGACLDACQALPNCTYMSYNGTTKECRLFSGAPKAVRDVNFYSASAKCRLF